jgi:hypothetical protein
MDSAHILLGFLYQQPALAQQKPLWQPGQIGLDAGILPSPSVVPAFGDSWERTERTRRLASDFNP